MGELAMLLTVYTIYAWIGLVVSSLVLLALCFLSAQLGRLLCKNLLKVYRLETIRHWLRKMELNGTHVMSRAAQDALDAKIKAKEQP